jgi:hypothetical protein
MFQNKKHKIYCMTSSHKKEGKRTKGIGHYLCECRDKLLLSLLIDVGKTHSFLNKKNNTNGNDLVGIDNKQLVENGDFVVYFVLVIIPVICC